MSYLELSIGIVIGIALSSAFPKLPEWLREVSERFQKNQNLKK